MDIGEIVSDSIKYPTSNWGKVLILGVIMIASFLIVPVFLLIGYLFRIIKATLAGLDELPEFDEVGEMFIDGLKVFVVGIVYSIPVIIISLINNRNNWKFNICNSQFKPSYDMGISVSIYCLYNCSSNCRVN
jgi:hypothetical protein